MGVTGLSASTLLDLCLCVSLCVCVYLSSLSRVYKVRFIGASATANQSASRLTDKTYGVSTLHHEDCMALGLQALVVSGSTS